LQRREAGLDLLEVADSVRRAHDLDPAAVGPGRHEVDLIEGIVAVFRLPERAGEGIKSEAEAVAATIRKDLADVGDHFIELGRAKGHAGLLFELGDLLRRDVGEGIVARRRAVGIEPEDGPGNVGVVRRRTAELVVGLSGAERAAGQVL
jgi:hypothetical protein